MVLNLIKAESILKKAVLKSEELNLNVAIAIFDSEHDLVLFQKMDNTQDLCVKLSQAKALTALKLLFLRSIVKHRLRNVHGKIAGQLFMVGT